MDQVLLSEKVLQFGTGVLLRGLPDYFINQANEQNIFNGRIVVVKSTAGEAKDFEVNDCRYTACIRGLSQGKLVNEDVTISSISRVLLAGRQWQEVLSVAANPSVQLIVSNTTEVGIAYVQESVSAGVPTSYPAKLTACLFHRFQVLKSASPKLVVIPTELVPDNGKLLQDLVMKHCADNGLSKEFVIWISEKVIFCNSLVDRIVTKPSERIKSLLATANALTIQTEPYKLWAIEGDGGLKDILTFSGVDEGIIIADNIEHFRERKLRLLNGAGTLMACLGYLSGLRTVFECTQDRVMSSYIEEVMLSEIQPTLPKEKHDDTLKFAHSVIERWKNEYTVHHLLSIAFQGTTKMRMRNVPTLFRYAERFAKAPVYMTKGFAAHLVFMKVHHVEGKNYFGVRAGESYKIDDDYAPFFHSAWQDVKYNKDSIKEFVTKLSQNKDIWGNDLRSLPEFVEQVTNHVYDLVEPF